MLFRSYEQLSYQIYLSEDQKTEILSQRAQQEIEITRLTSLKNHLLRKIDTYDLHKIYLELKDFERQKAEVDAKLQVLLQKTEESKDEIEKIGCRLYALYSENVKKLKDQRQSEEKTLAETERARENAERERDEKEREIRKLSGDIGAKESRVKIGRASCRERV